MKFKIKYKIKIMIEENYIINDITYNIKIGRNALENDNLVKTADQNDWWFHIDKFSSCHIILKKCILNKEILNKVHELIFKYTNKVPSNAKVIYTEIKNVKRTLTPGKVTVKKYKLI